MNNGHTNSLLRLEDSDRERLGESLRLLLDHGSILGDGGPHTALYHWAYANRPWLEEICDLFDLQLYWENEQRLLQAVPRSNEFLLRLRLDATLVLLVLWYEFDSAVRDRSESPPIFLTVEQLNDSLSTKFEPMKKSMPSHTRLIEILRLAKRKNLLRFTTTSDPAQTRIEVLSTIKRVIPFQDISDWVHYADRFLAAEEDDSTREGINDENT